MPEPSQKETSGTSGGQLDWNTEPVKSEVGNEPALTLRWLQ